MTLGILPDAEALDKTSDAFNKNWTGYMQRCADSDCAPQSWVAWLMAGGYALLLFLPALGLCVIFAVLNYFTINSTTLAMAIGFIALAIFAAVYIGAKRIFSQK
ncbi:MAG: hypothetical protein ACI93R_003996 [Flavobacteriales bacterium]|jgi:hypothetical protein